MVTHFAPAPIAWELKVKYQLPAWARGYDGWKPKAFPVIGWAYTEDRSGGPLVVWVSYRGRPAPMDSVLEDLKVEAAERAQRQHQTSDAITISYELAPA